MRLQQTFGYVGAVSNELHSVASNEHEFRRCRAQYVYDSADEGAMVGVELKQGILAYPVFFPGVAFVMSSAVLLG